MAWQTPLPIEDFVVSGGPKPIKAFVSGKTDALGEDALVAVVVVPNSTKSSEITWPNTKNLESFIKNKLSEDQRSKLIGVKFRRESEAWNF